MGKMLTNYGRLKKGYAYKIKGEGPDWFFIKNIYVPKTLVYAV